MPRYFAACFDGNCGGRRVWAFDLLSLVPVFGAFLEKETGCAPDYSDIAVAVML